MCGAFGARQFDKIDVRNNQTAAPGFKRRQEPRAKLRVT